jgi:hypothetical protein
MEWAVNKAYKNLNKCREVTAFSSKRITLSCRFVRANETRTAVTILKAKAANTDKNEWKCGVQRSFYDLHSMTD